MISFESPLQDILREKFPQYDPAAFAFVFLALERLKEQMTDLTHVSGAELGAAYRDLGLSTFGCMTRLVFEHWGLRTTADIGSLVFGLVSLELMSAREEDLPSDFDNLWDFESLDTDYHIGRSLAAASSDRSS